MTTQLPASLARRLADPHKTPGFMDGERACRVCLKRIEECRLVDGPFVCEREVPK